jgi:hypothetical protein
VEQRTHFAILDLFSASGSFISMVVLCSYLFLTEDWFERGGTAGRSCHVDRTFIYQLNLSSVLFCRVDEVDMEARVGCMHDAQISTLLDLKVARDRKGRAPNKPLLLLAILDLVEAGLVGADGLAHKDAQLNLRFRSYSPICVPRRGNAIDLGLPFRHLASDGAIPY